jgi:hypothetical protein
VRIASDGILHNWQHHLYYRITEKLGGGMGRLQCKTAAYSDYTLYGGVATPDGGST